MIGTGGIAYKVIAKGIIDEAIKTGSVSLIAKFFHFLFKDSYKNRLVKIIYKTTDQYEQAHCIDIEEDKIPFYHSQILFDELNKYVFFQKGISDDLLVLRFNENPHIMIPTKEEIEDFYNIFYENIKKDKRIKKLYIGENYQGEVFRISNSLEILNVQMKRIMKLVSFNPDKKWFVQQNECAIVDLGNRYSPELNFFLPEAFVFDGIGRTEDFRIKAKEHLDVFLKKGERILGFFQKAEIEIGNDDRFDNHEKDEELKELKDDLAKLSSLFESIDFLGTEKIDEDMILNSVNKLFEKVYNLNKYCLEKKKNKIEKGTLEKINSIIRSIDIFLDEKYFLDSFFKSAAFKLANQPVLVLSGEAGIGKSHLTADIVTRRNELGLESILLLGQQFLEDDNPWAQIFKLLQINTTKDDFLNALNTRAEKNKKRIIIFIDAINEGRGKYFWPNFINGFINEFEKYPWLALVITIRSSYVKLFLGETISRGFVEYKWRGFETHEYEASKWFFERYGIAVPSMPILTPEFRNALFLKLFCESIKKAGLKEIPKEIRGITSIIDLWINSANNAIASPNIANYSSGFNLVKRAIDALVGYEFENDVRFIPYEKAYELVQNVTSHYTDKKDFLELIISEGILTKNILGDSDEESVYITYERFEDHLIVRYLLERYTNLDEAFAENGELYQFVKDNRSLNIYNGILEAFSIQVPEKKGKEFFEYIDEQYRNSYVVVAAFVESISWRKGNSYTDRSYDYIKNSVFSMWDTINQFYETIISVATIPNHHFNANTLHKRLSTLTMAKRDASWTRILRNIYFEQSAIERLTEWAWDSYEDRTYLSDEAIELASTALAWFLTSTIRRLRDISTKGLVCLLKDRLDVLLKILKKFEKVDDPYVHERLYTAAYSCVLMTMQKEKIKELSEYIYETIFKEKEEVYPNVLIRDYARCVIEYAYYLKLELSFDILEVRPPYKSNLPDKIMSNEEIDFKYLLDVKDTDPKWYYSQNKIIRSMVTEYGRGTGGYGDFGRYVFQSALRSFDVNADKMSNLAVEWIFEKYGYNVNMHGEYDRNVSISTREYPEIERIGKKYQWIALYEIVARVSDNCKRYNEFSFSKQTEEPFKGPWDMFIRKIDPTVLFKHIDTNNRKTKNICWWEPTVTVNWNLSDKEWTRITDDLPNYSEWIKVEDFEKEKWLVLQAYPSWNNREYNIEDRERYPYKEFWTQIRSYLVKNEDFDKMKEWFVSQDFMGRWMPESAETSEMFYRELYWSPIYNEFMDNYYEGSIWCDIEEPESGEVVGKVLVTAEEYSWSPDDDRSMSIDDTIAFLMPRKYIFDGMGLKFGNQEGELLDEETGELVSFSTNDFYNSKLYLLIKEEPFKKFLEEKGLKIIWTILGEKNIISGGFGGIGRIEISGAYYYEGKEIKGTINKKNCNY